MNSSVEGIKIDEEEDATASPSTLHPLVSLAHTYGDNPRKDHLSRKRGAINGLQLALQERLIVPLDRDEFKWSHDRYSQAAMAMVPPNVAEQIHYNIAMYYLQG